MIIVSVGIISITGFGFHDDRTISAVVYTEANRVIPNFDIQTELASRQAKSLWSSAPQVESTKKTEETNRNSNEVKKYLITIFLNNFFRIIFP